MKKLFASYRLFWEDIKDFKGKMSRGDYWRAMLVHYVATIIILSSLSLLFPFGNLEGIETFIFFASGLLTIPAGVRRLNDMGRTWKAMLWALIPAYGWIAVLCMCCRATGAVKPKKKTCKNGQHQWVYERESCREVCGKCGESRTRHEYQPVSGECAEKCSVCGAVKPLAHQFGPNGVCRICGCKDNRVTLSGFSNDELNAVRMAVDTMKQVNKDPKLAPTYHDIRSKLNGSAPRLELGELAVVASCVVAVMQAIGSDVNKFINMGNNNGGVNAANLLTALNLKSALDKLNKLMQEINEKNKAAADTKAAAGSGTGKKPLSEFAPYDESYQGYVKGGVCDVCGKPIDGKKTYAVPNDIFYASPEYREHLKQLQKKLFGHDLTEKDIDFRASQDHSPGSAVCEDCIHMFAEMPAAEEALKEEAPKTETESEPAAAPVIAEQPKKQGTFYVFAAQGPAFGQPEGDMVAEKAENLRGEYAPAENMEFKLVRPYAWEGRVKSSSGAGIISSSFSLSDAKDAIRKYLKAAGESDAAIEKGIAVSAEKSLQLTNPFSGVYVIGVPVGGAEGEAPAVEEKTEETPA